MKSLALSEYQEQCIVADYMRKRWPKVLFTATLGGVRVSIGAAVKLKKQGYLKGVPDLLICKAREREVYDPVLSVMVKIIERHHGLVIEMKVKKGGVVSDDQKRVLKQFQDEGWLAIVCHGADEAIAAIEEYLK